MDSQTLYIAAGLAVALLVASGLIVENTGFLDSDSVEKQESENDPAGTETSTEDVDWKSVQLEEVESGEKFSIAEIDEPVMIQTFAVWCPKCDRQQEQKGKLAERRDDFEPVSLSIDPNEDAQQIASHKQQNGFDWKYAVASSEVANGLVEEFGQTMLNAPTSSVAIICENGETQGPYNGVQSADELGQNLDEAC